MKYHEGDDTKESPEGNHEAQNARDNLAKYIRTPTLNAPPHIELRGAEEFKRKSGCKPDDDEKPTKDAGVRDLGCGRRHWFWHGYFTEDNEQPYGDVDEREEPEQGVSASMNVIAD